MERGPIVASHISVAGDFVTAAAARAAVISLNGQLSPCVRLVLVHTASLSFRWPRLWPTQDNVLQACSRQPHKAFVAGAVLVFLHWMLPGAFGAMHFLCFV